MLVDLHMTHHGYMYQIAILSLSRITIFIGGIFSWLFVYSQHLLMFIEKWHSRMVKAVHSEPIMPGFNSVFFNYCILHWALLNYWISLCLSLLLCNMEIVILPTSSSCMIKCFNVCMYSITSPVTIYVALVFIIFTIFFIVIKVICPRMAVLVAE